MASIPKSSSTTGRWAMVIGAIATLAIGLAGNAGAAATPTCDGRRATIVGTEGDDRLTGTNGPDVIVGLGGKDKIFGLGGSDVICGGRGRDRIFGGSGSDKIWGNGGNDRINGHIGKDTIRGGNGQDYILGRSGDDVIFGEAGHDRLFGGRGNDTLDGGDGNDTLDGDLDLDILKGQLGTDYCEPSLDSATGCELPGSSSNRGGVPYENQMMSMINTERIGAGLDPLSRHVDLDAYALDWSIEMSAIPLPLSASQHHSPAFTGSNYPFRSLPTSVSWTAAFENVGYATVGSGETAEATMTRLFYAPNGFGFMSSPGHRCNILETAADEIGVGAVVDSSGDVWVVQVFWGTDSPLDTPIGECVGVVGR